MIYMIRMNPSLAKGWGPCVSLGHVSPVPSQVKGSMHPHGWGLVMYWGHVMPRVPAPCGWAAFHTVVLVLS